MVLENVVDWGETEPYRVLVQKGDPKGLLEGINKAIAELTANDGALIKEIENKVASQETYTPQATRLSAISMASINARNFFIFFISFQNTLLAPLRPSCFRRRRNDTSGQLLLTVDTIHPLCI